MNSDNLIIRIPKEVKAKLKKVAEKENTTMSKIVKDFIKSRVSEVVIK